MLHLIRHLKFQEKYIHLDWRKRFSDIFPTKLTQISKEKEKTRLSNFI